MVFDLEMAEHSFEGRFHTLEVEIAAHPPRVIIGIVQGFVSEETFSGTSVTSQGKAIKGSWKGDTKLEVATLLETL